MSKSLDQAAQSLKRCVARCTSARASHTELGEAHNKLAELKKNARAQASGLSAEMNKLARASAAGLIDPAGTARLQQVAGDMIQARANASALAGSLERAGVSVGASSRGSSWREVSASFRARRCAKDGRAVAPYGAR